MKFECNISKNRRGRGRAGLVCCQPVIVAGPTLPVGRAASVQWILDQRTRVFLTVSDCDDRCGRGDRQAVQQVWATVGLVGTFESDVVFQVHRHSDTGFRWSRPADPRDSLARGDHGVGLSDGDLPSEYGDP